LSWLKALQVNTAERFVLSGFLLGLAYHTKPVMGLFPVVVLVFLSWLHPENKRAIVKGFTWFCLAFALVLMPWVVRNYLVFQKFIPGSTLLGYVLYNDFRDQLERKHLLQNENGVWLVPQDLILENTSQADYRLGKSEAELDQLWINTSVELIKLYPKEFGLWCLNNVTRFWLNVGRDKWDHPGTTGFSFAGLANAFILMMSVLTYGLSNAARQKLALTLPVLVIYFTAVHALTSSELRYSIPMIPFLLILTAVALWELSDRFMKRNKPGLKTSVLLEADSYAGNPDADRITL
jgi:hypothetical protein